MRPASLSRFLQALAVWLLLSAPSAIAGPPTPPPTDPEVALQKALDLERQRKWTAAIEAYESALEVWPGRSDFRHRQRLCESHYKLGRRYQDRSFREVLLRLPKDRALDLFDEVLERIETNYVEPVAFEPLLRRGFDNMEVALRDPAFLKAHGADQIPADRVKWLRGAFAGRREAVVARNRAEARAQVASACDLAAQAIGVGAAPVALEFVFGACDGLPDDYSSYLTPDKLDDLFAMIDGNFVGLGVELKQDELGLRLVGVMAGGPASEAGLKVGDRITHIGGVSVQGLGIDESAGRLQGAEGTSVAITVLQANGASRTFPLIRREVEVQSVAPPKIVDREGGVGYVQLNGFQKSSTEELRRAIAGLQAQGMRHLILDLRGNPGGLLNVSVEIADRFLDGGVIVSTRGRAPGQSYVYKAHSAPIWRMPLTVLIDHDSASASEILAGALKDHRRARVVGESKSYGKGSVQSIFPLRTTTAGLKLTTAKFYSPLDRSYSEQGVEPDVLVQNSLRPAFADPSAGAPAAPAVEIGDPSRDPVLEKAIQLIRKPMARAG